MKIKIMLRYSLFKEEVSVTTLRKNSVATVSNNILHNHHRGLDQIITLWCSLIVTTVRLFVTIRVVRGSHSLLFFVHPLDGIDQMISLVAETLFFLLMDATVPDNILHHHHGFV